jgi:hypothetical protein
VCQKTCKHIVDACDDCIDEAYTNWRLAQLNKAKPGQFTTDRKATVPCESAVIRSKPFIQSTGPYETL